MPFGVGVATPGAGAETGNVDKDAVEALLVALDPFVMLAGNHAALDIIDAGAAQPHPGALQSAGRDVAGDELAAVSHQSGERQALAAGPGAEIDDPHAGPGIGEQGRHLRTLVLDLDEPFLECDETGERR